MTFPRSKRRTIVVDGHSISWVASGDSGFIQLRLMLTVGAGQRLSCQFGYHQRLNSVLDREGQMATDQFVVTPYIVRQVASFGFANGWRPLETGRELRLGFMDDKVDLRLGENMASAAKAASRSVLPTTRSDGDSGC